MPGKFASIDVEERLLLGRVGRHGAVEGQQLGRGDERGQGLEGRVRDLGGLEQAEGVGVELGRDRAVVGRGDREAEVLTLGLAGAAG